MKALLERWPQLSEVLKLGGVDLADAARKHPQSTLICAVGQQPWPAESHRQAAVCRLRLQAAADALEQQFARDERYPAQACAQCPSGGTVSYRCEGTEFELMCRGPHHTNCYSSLNGFADEPSPVAPDCALAVVPPAPVYPWWSPSRYTARPEAPLVLCGPAQLVPAHVQPGQLELQARCELVQDWVPVELAGVLRGCSHVSLTFSSAQQRGQLRAYDSASVPLPGGDPSPWLGRLPDSPLALAYERNFAHSLGLRLREPVRFDPAAAQLLDCWGQATPGWVAWSAQVDLADWRHERGRLCAGRTSAVGVSPESPVQGQGPDLQVQRGSDHARIGLGQEPDGPTLPWTDFESLPGPPGAGGRISSAQLVPGLQHELRWVAGRDAHGLWLVFSAGECPAPPVATAVPSLGPDVESLYKRNLTVIAGR